MNTKRARLLMAVATGIVIIIAIIMGVYYGVSYFSEANKLADLLKTGNSYMDSGDYETAVKYYDDALNYEPESEEIRNAISYAYIKIAENTEASADAVEAYQKSLMYNKTNKTPYWGIANIYEQLGDEDNMIVSLQTGYDNTGDETMYQKGALLFEVLSIRNDIDFKELNAAFNNPLLNFFLYQSSLKFVWMSIR